MRAQGANNAVSTSAAAKSDGAGKVGGEEGRGTPLRVDAQRNLEHVLRAAREVFGEVGYGAPMEDVARRAKVGVGTVYRRFSSKEVLVRRIAAQETARLTEQARRALERPDGPWEALSSFLRTSVASGAGRLLPPRVLRVGQESSSATPPPSTAPPGAPVATSAASAADHPDVEVPEPAHTPGSADPRGTTAEGADAPPGGVPLVRVPRQRDTGDVGTATGTKEAGTDAPDVSSGAHPTHSGDAGAAPDGDADPDAGAAELLAVVGRLVDRARAAGELREDVSVADVLLVIATAGPALPDAVQQSAASERLLDILLAGLRSRPPEAAD